MEQRRGRISKIDLLPEEAWPYVKKALNALSARKREAEDIRKELNNHLLTIEGAEPISKSSFNRKSLSLAKIGADIAQAREMAAVFAEKLNEMPEGDVGMLINEMCKVIIYNMTENIAANDVEVAAKYLKEISLSLYRLEQSHQISAKRRVVIEDRAKASASEAVEKVAKAKGLSADIVDQIKGEILGIANT